MQRLASLKLTLVGMLLLLAGVLTSYRDPAASIWWLVAPLGLLGVNLLSAVLFSPRFRRQTGLLVFHVCLLGILVLAAVGQLMSLTGRVEITEGQRFEPALVQVVKQGPWHPWQRLDSVQFAQGHFVVDYGAQLVRGRTVSHVDTTGGAPRHSVEFGDSDPLTLSGYRFYTTSNKGYAAVLSWRGDDGTVQTGAVHLPSYPVQDWNQRQSWTTPAGTPIEIGLSVPARGSDQQPWRLDSRRAAGQLTVAVDGQLPVTLRPGEQVSLPGGQLAYMQARMWMGYELFYDPTLPWLIVAALLAVAALAWHFWEKLWSRPLPGQRPRITDEYHERVVRI